MSESTLQNGMTSFASGKDTSSRASEATPPPNGKYCTTRLWRKTFSYAPNIKPLDCRKPLQCSPACFCSVFFQQSRLSLSFLKQTCVYTEPAASVVSHHCAVFAWAAAWVACLGVAGITQCRAAHRVLRTGWRGCLGWLRLPLLVASGQTGNQFKDFLCNSD